MLSAKYLPVRSIGIIQPPEDAVNVFLPRLHASEAEDDHAALNPHSLMLNGRRQAVNDLKQFSCHKCCYTNSDTTAETNQTAFKSGNNPANGCQETVKMQVNHATYALVR